VQAFFVFAAGFFIGNKKADPQVGRLHNNP
jgi:hypothetical protein